MMTRRPACAFCFRAFVPRNQVGKRSGKPRKTGPEKIGSPPRPPRLQGKQRKSGKGRTGRRIGALKKILALATGLFYRTWDIALKGSFKRKMMMLDQILGYCTLFSDKLTCVCSGSGSLQMKMQYGCLRFTMVYCIPQQRRPASHRNL